MGNQQPNFFCFCGTRVWSQKAERACKSLIQYAVDYLPQPLQLHYILGLLGEIDAYYGERTSKQLASFAHTLLKRNSLTENHPAPRPTKR